jgi:phosphomannomutase
MGLLAVLRSQKLQGKVIGAMVTASHNPAEVGFCLVTWWLGLKLNDVLI